MKLESKIKELQAATETLQQQVAARQIDENGYNERRVEINVLLIEIALGAEFTEKKDGSFAVKFNKPLPTKEECAMAYTVIDTFVKSVESGDAEEDDDMQIPLNIGNQLPAVEKISAKVLKNIIFGGDGTTSILQLRLNGNDFIELSVWGEKLHKKKIFWTWLIVGASSAVVIGGGITAGVIIAKHCKKAEKEDTVAEIETIETTEDIDDIPDTVEIDDIEVSNELY